MPLWRSIPRFFSQQTASLSPSPLLRPENVQHTFRWGVGNKFRAQNANRFTPVHHERPKEVTVAKNYFASPDTGGVLLKFDRNEQRHPIVYDATNEQWEVFWYEHNKVHAKPFPVKKFGVNPSKAEAIKFFEQMKAKGVYEESVSEQQPRSDNENVFWDNRLQSWVALVRGGVREGDQGGYKKNLKKMKKSVTSAGKPIFFSSSKNGLEGGRIRAEGCANKYASNLTQLRQRLSDLVRETAKKQAVLSSDP